MPRTGPKILVTEPEDDTEERMSIIRTSRQLMVPELRASVRERVSNLRPGGLPLPGKTTQGFRGSRSSSSRESARPQSFRTVRNFWRRLEGAEDTPPPPPRRFGPLKKPMRAEEPDKPKTGGWKMPVLRKVSNARESARRISIKRPSLKSNNESRKSVSTEVIKRPSISSQSKRASLFNEEIKRQSIKSTKRPSVKSLSSRKGSGVSQYIDKLPNIPKRASKAESMNSKRPSLLPVPIDYDPSRRASRLSKQSVKTKASGSFTVPSPMIDFDNRRGSNLSKQSVKTKASGSFTVPSPMIDFDNRRGSNLSKQRTSFSPSERRSVNLSPRGSYLEQIEEEGNRIAKGEVLDEAMEEEEEVATEIKRPSVSVSERRASKQSARGSYLEQLEERREAEKGMDGEAVDEEEEVVLDEEMVEEEEEYEPSAKFRSSQRLSLSPPTAGLRPSSLWGHLPRFFSEESMSRPSVILPVLLEEEKLFHELVAGGDVSAVSDFINKRPDFNINCENYQGTSALHIAVKDDNEDMVQYLLSLPGIEVRDSHLFAIRDNHPGILVMILDKLQSINPALEFMACSNSPEFAENVTPLILAAEAGHFEIVGLLISRGHVIPRPHKPRCFCKEECQAIMKSQDMLSISSGKLHIYRALCNPAYICQNSSDPLMVAFKLSKELLTCGHVDAIYLRQYEALAESLRRFAVEIIAECRTLEEVETILSESKDSDLTGNWTYPRLIMAMDYKQKEFIAHPNVQQVLERTWMGDWIAWRGYRVYIKALYIFPRLVTLPVVLGVLMFTPTSKWAKHFSLPVNKLLSNVASYCIFLLLVFIQSNVNKKNQTRDTKPTGVEIFLVIYVLTFIYNSIRSLLKQGVHRFFKFMWNIYELVMELFFIIAFVFLIAAEIKTTIKGNKNVERKYWHYLDPELISESFFVLAAIMAFMRILLIFQISYHLGPLQVSLGKMTNDCAMFSVIFAIIIIAFTAGLCKFYSYYEDMVQTNPDTGEVESSQVNSFTGVLDTFKTLFWGLFGMSSFDVADVIVENLEDNSSNSTTTNEHHLTEAVGYFAFATYMILTVIVILNMLIATMSNTFQKVTDNLDTEWLFGRTEVYMSYIDLPVLPPPFNVIPTTHALVNLVKGYKTKARNLIGVDVEKGIIEEPENKRNDDYYVLMSQLVQRYFSTKNSEND
ncbi:unnamed protein product [Nezara viridula]|uniref:Transient receptor ion channel domain-containing protein n=1 Tax=Nezara viridula TaxID=85310 RepID=A0A9P0HVD6_NEZVI|nr:unnamed protein product [Nezara viridula]